MSESTPNHVDEHTEDAPSDAAADEGGIVDLPHTHQDRTGNESADEADAPDADAGSSSSSQATRLVELAKDAGVELFVDTRGDEYARVPVNEHYEVLSLASSSFGKWLRQRAYADWGKAPSSQATTDARNNLCASAAYQGYVETVYLRVAAIDDTIILDLGQPEWGVVRVTKRGWECLSDSPVAFRRPSGLGALPSPVRGGTLDALRPFVNCSDDDWPLILAWLVCSLSGRGPYPTLFLSGSHSSAKSTTARMLRKIVDPNASLYRGEPTSERDFAIGAQNNWVVALDNVSTIKPWMSDALCRLVTGGGFAARKLYSNDEETVFELQRPALITAITDVATRADLRDRIWHVALPPIQVRRAENALNADFDAAAPLIFGALLDALVVGLRNVDQVGTTAEVRLVDAAVWAEACAPAFGISDLSIPNLLKAKRDQAIQDTIAASPMLTALLDELDANAGDIEGSATELLRRLSCRVRHRDLPSNEWPRSPKVLSERLDRAAGDLRALGIHVTRDRRSNRNRDRFTRIRRETSREFVRCVREGSEPSEPASTQQVTGGRSDGRSRDSSVRSPSASSEARGEGEKEERDMFADFELPEEGDR